MEEIIYKNILLVSSVTMYAYGLFSLLTILPEGKEYSSFGISRKFFGVTMIIWATYILVQSCFDFRETDKFLATTLNLSCYYLCAMLFEVIYSSLIDSTYPFRQRVKRIILTTIFVNVVLTFNYCVIPAPVNDIVIIFIAVCFGIEVIYLSHHFLKRYRKALKRAENYYSDNTRIFVQWMLNSVWLVIIFGFAGTITSFASKIGISIYMFGGLLVFSYIFFSLQNYMVNITKMKDLLLIESQNQPEVIVAESKTEDIIVKKLNVWIASKGFTQRSLTIEELAAEVGTNRTYLSSYINSIFNLSFRDWMAKMRIEYAKELLIKHPDFSANKVADMVGYSPNAFSTIFFKLESKTPTRWRNHSNNKTL